MFFRNTNPMISRRLEPIALSVARGYPVLAVNRATTGGQDDVGPRGLRPPALRHPRGPSRTGGVRRGRSSVARSISRRRGHRRDPALPRSPSVAAGHRRRGSPHGTVGADGLATTGGHGQGLAEPRGTCRAARADAVQPRRAVGRASRAEGRGRSDLEGRLSAGSRSPRGGRTLARGLHRDLRRARRAHARGGPRSHALRRVLAALRDPHGSNPSTSRASRPSSGSTPRRRAGGCRCSSRGTSFTSCRRITRTWASGSRSTPSSTFWTPAWRVA